MGHLRWAGGHLYHLVLHLLHLWSKNIRVSKDNSGSLLGSSFVSFARASPADYCSPDSDCLMMVRRRNDHVLSSSHSHLFLDMLDNGDG